jgi:hypothetical protein
MFQKALQFWVTIVFCYNKQTTSRVIAQVPRPLMWHIYQIIVDFFFPIVIICVLNQSMDIGCFMMHYILQFFMSLKLKG